MQKNSPLIRVISLVQIFKLVTNNFLEIVKLLVCAIMAFLADREGAVHMKHNYTMSRDPIKLQQINQLRIYSMAWGRIFSIIFMKTLIKLMDSLPV